MPRALQKTMHIHHKPVVRQQWIWLLALIVASASASIGTAAGLAPKASVPGEAARTLGADTIPLVAGLLLLSTVGIVAVGVRYACGQSQAATQHATAPAKWTILFHSDDPSVWDTDNKGRKFAVPLQCAPADMCYLRLRRMDTGEALILPLSYAELRNGEPPSPAGGSWWNGTATKEWHGGHLGIAQVPRHRFPAPKDLIGVMSERLEFFSGSGFGHKCFVNDKQYYCWRGKEIPRTFFEVAVTEGPLSPQEKRCLVSPYPARSAPGG
jgi:hypothetical protein